MEIIRLRHVKNYRDLGGFKTKDGRTLKKGMLIRGTALKKLTGNDIKILTGERNLRTIIDLRTPKEAAEKPDVVPEGVEYNLMPVFDEALLGISHEKKVKSMESLYNLPAMEDLYVQMVSPENLDNLARILRTILLMPEDKFSVIFHCSAGKDRTGILAVLLLTFLGVSRVDIMDDYLMTNRGSSRIKSRLAWIAGILIVRNSVFAGKVRNYLRADEKFINASIREIERQYGSLESFIQEKLNFPEEEISRIREKFLV